ncbi:hypothetical protein D3874_23090 [Oleomonas cavernae]|uniref:Uncharacterized protein n=1 Tax=Oleomonas cavernae TaxID=2320859 RepID=A0A418WHM6_9PROT|nr:hypothetical protein [Oleomonas cavernae]RJF89500.1 hypothetical protein D3874_23090 [Oleomonas cavernae]
MSKLGQDLIASVNEAIAIAKGEATLARAFTANKIGVAKTPLDAAVARLASQVDRLDPASEDEALAWIETVSIFDTRDGSG